MQVKLSDGSTGFGEGVVPGGAWWGGETVETMQVIVERYLAPATIGRKASEISGIVHDWERHVANMRFAKAGLEIALFDAYARSTSLSPTSSAASSAIASTAPGHSAYYRLSKP